jgi:hypothetical protein
VSKVDSIAMLRMFFSIFMHQKDKLIVLIANNSYIILIVLAHKILYYFYKKYYFASFLGHMSLKNFESANPVNRPPTTKNTVFRPRGSRIQTKTLQQTIGNKQLDFLVRF